VFPDPGVPTRFPTRLIWAVVALTAIVSVVALLPVTGPRVEPASFWQVAEVPAGMWALVIGAAVLCVGVAALLTFRRLGLRWSDPVAQAWTALLVVSAAGISWNAMYSAALSTTDFGAVIPIFHWMFTLIPAVLAGALFRRRGRLDCWTAALGTGMVTLPLFQLSSMLLTSGGPALSVLLGGVTFTAILGAAPLVGGVAIAGAMSQERAVGGPQPSMR
jgi:hypothetical protein